MSDFANTSVSNRERSMVIRCFLKIVNCQLGRQKGPLQREYKTSAYKVHGRLRRKVILVQFTCRKPL